MTDLVSMKEAAAALRVSRNTVARHLPGIRVGRRTLYRRSDLNNIINSVSGPALHLEGGAAPISEAANG